MSERSSDGATNLPEVLVVFANVAVDVRNGGGMESLNRYLKELSLPAIFSCHLGYTKLQGRHDLSGVRYHEFGRGWFTLLRSYFLLHQFARRLPAQKTVALLLPNDWRDTLWCLAASWVFKNNFVWIMDDFVSVPAVGWRGRLRSALSRWALARLYHSAQKRVVVSHSMKRAYKQRYRKEADQVLGIRWPWALFAEPSSAAPEGSSAVRIAWLGKFMPFYAGPIYALAECFRRHKMQSCEVHFFGRERPNDQALLAPFMSYQGELPSEGIVATLKQYDYGLLTYSFDSHTRSYMSLSFPGKLVDYLTASLPVLTIAPSELSICEELRERRVGPFCHSLDLAELSQVVQSLPSRGTLAHQAWSAAAHDWAVSDFVMESGIELLRQLIATSPNSN